MPDAGPIPPRMTRAGLVAASLALALMTFSMPAHAVCTSPEFILGDGGSCEGGGGGGCHTYTEEGSSGQDSTSITECSDGYYCEAHNHYNDPDEPPSTTFEPPGCENDPRQGI